MTTRPETDTNGEFAEMRAALSGAQEALEETEHNTWQKMHELGNTISHQRAHIHRLTERIEAMEVLVDDLFSPESPLPTVPQMTRAQVEAYRTTQAHLRRLWFTGK